MGASYSQTFEESLPLQTGKTIVITGTSSGTGNVLSKWCVKKGGNVIMMNRPSSRSEAAQKDVESYCAEGGTVKTVHVDLMDFDSVRDAAKEVKEICGEEGIDVLCNNAGIMAFPNEATKDGYEKQMQTNHLSHFLLTKELYPLLEKRAEKVGEARVVNHSSAAASTEAGYVMQPQFLKKMEKDGDPSLGDDTAGDYSYPDPTKRGGRIMRYYYSKLANGLFTTAMHDKLQAKGSKVKCMVAHPGLANTGLASNAINTGGFDVGIPNFNFPGKETLMNLSMKLMGAQSEEDGALGIGRACLQEGVESNTLWGPAGKTFKELESGDAVQMELWPNFTDEASKEMLWELSEEAVGAFEIY